MKKTGILNADLAYHMAQLRHMDYVMICDAGYPIPKGSTIVDVSLVEGFPTVPQVLKALVGECVFQDYTILAPMKEVNPVYYQLVTALFQVQDKFELPMDEFRAKAAEYAKFYIRTGDTRPCSNILLMSASGVKERVEKYDVNWPENWFDVLFSEEYPDISNPRKT